MPAQSHITMPLMSRPPPRWDIFCRVIDNYGDVGVCWRLATQLADRLRTKRLEASKSQLQPSIRLWLDNTSSLSWMAPFGHPGVQVLPWQDAPGDGPMADGVIEAFGCELPEIVRQALVRRACDTPTPCAHTTLAWINLEYLCAEAYVERSHGLPSPVLAGAGSGLVKHFFYPGFKPGTGGLLREPDLQMRQAAFRPSDWLQAKQIPIHEHEIRISLFCYEPQVLATWLQACAQGTQPMRLLVTSGRAHAAMQTACQYLGWPAADAGQQGDLSWHRLPWLTQHDYDHLLWSCDLNFVRGEDSLVRAIWADRPFVWQIYPQEDMAHQAKLRAFMDCAGMSGNWREWHELWNHSGWPNHAPIPPIELSTWQKQAQQFRQKLLMQDDLLTQLLRFVANQR